jgi:hypothetical protein
VTHNTLSILKRQAKRYGITHDQIAETAHVGRTLVSHVLAGRAKSANVVATARRLIAVRRAGRQRALEVEERASPQGAEKRSPASALLKHATGWAGGDLEERLAEVAAQRSPTRA